MPGFSPVSDAEADRRQHPKSGEMPTAALFLEQSPGQGIVLPRAEGCCRQQMDKNHQNTVYGMFTFFSGIRSNTFSFLAAYGGVWGFYGFFKSYF